MAGEGVFGTMLGRFGSGFTDERDRQMKMAQIEMQNKRQAAMDADHMQTSALQRAVGTFNMGAPERQQAEFDHKQKAAHGMILQRFGEKESGGVDFRPGMDYAAQYDNLLGNERAAATAKAADERMMEGKRFDVANRAPLAPNNYDEVKRHNLAMERLAGQRATTGGVQGQRIQATYKKQAQTLDNLQDAIKTYRTQLTNTGIEVMPGAKKSLLTGSYANLKLLAKEAANLGALTGPDVKILEELFNDPATLTSAGLNVLQGGQRAKGLLDQLGQYESIIKGNRSRLEQNYGEQAARPSVRLPNEDY